jgi:hypothetical protein
LKGALCGFVIGTLVSTAAAAAAPAHVAWLNHHRSRAQLPLACFDAGAVDQKALPGLDHRASHPRSTGEPVEAPNSDLPAVAERGYLTGVSEFAAGLAAAADCEPPRGESFTFCGGLKLRARSRPLRCTRRARRCRRRPAGRG